MGDFFKKIVDFFKNTFSKLNKNQKIIIISVAAAIIIALILIISFSSKPDKTLLFQKPLTPEDYAKVTKALSDMNVDFSTKDDKYIVVKDTKTAETLRMKLGQQGVIPNNVTGWELFDTQKWTTTDFERDVNLKRAVKGEIERQLKLLDGIEDCYLNVAWPKETLFSTNAEPVTASLTIIPKPYSTLLENRKQIEGIKKLVAFGIPGLKEENVVITDPSGNIISDFSSEDQSSYLEIVKQQLQIKERERVKIEQRIREQLQKIIGQNKVDIQLDIDIKFDQIKSEADKIIPTVLKEDNPNTPYDDSVIAPNVTISEQTINKEYKGPQTIPEGPPGTEPNVPPGYKELLPSSIVMNENQQTKNYEISKEKVTTSLTPYQINKITCSVVVDGKWEIEVDEKGNLVVDKTKLGYKRKYTPVEQEELTKIEQVIKGAIGYDKARGDMVTVQNIPFNHETEFSAEDAIIKRKELIRKALITSFVSILLFLLIIVLYRVIAAELQRRKKLKEEELLRKQQELREKALRAAEKEGIEVELSMEEKARLEMQENAINIAREHPEEVAKLIRTWLAEDVT
ncbi:MAG: flagellar M-ring protein FliF [Spirochaetes bacterium]|nr:flagellar M-ring protein FliF [Spirochaetota bacterium]MBP8990708.1 flagellar M-ring protein FliF [Spirochaetota bacterium]NLJ04617.1 flagellar M-ring protein FliF [Exilispira sp.]HOV45731.1 flagellar basal-body MS-ring/collar protein FliF [Exilispira sp.]